MKTLGSCLIFFLVHFVYFAKTQKVPPGVNPQQYQQYQDPQYQQYQVPSQQIHVNQQQKYASQTPQMQQQQPPVQHQQPPVQHQQPPMQSQQPQMQQQQQAQHQRHQGQKMFGTANIEHEKEHIAEHLEVPIDTSKMTEQELQFHYFKMHDADNNNKLDGCELIKSLIHWHEKDGRGGIIYSDEDLIKSVDPILSEADINNDGFIDYSEFKKIN